MATPQVDGARSQRTGAAAGSSSTGSAPRLDATARARSKELAQQFAAQVQLSMAQSLMDLAQSGEAEDAEGEDGQEGETDLGLDLGTALGGAVNQAQLAALGGGLGIDGLTGAGAGSEAQLAKQLLASITGETAGVGGSGAAGAVAPIGAVDRGAAANARVVAQVAREQGVDPTTAVAMMLIESGGRATAVGDGGTSFGLYQLHQGGMLTAAGLTSQQAFDPRTNASVALKSFRHEWSKGHATRTPGEIAAASQRPADPVGYAAKVDGAMDRARALLAGATS